MDMNASPLTLLKDPSLLKTDALIHGQWVATSRRFEVLDPATGQKLAEVANLGPAEAEQAIAAANAAWPVWRSKTAKERSILMRKWHRLRQAFANSAGAHRSWWMDKTMSSPAMDDFLPRANSI